MFVRVRLSLCVFVNTASFSFSVVFLTTHVLPLHERLFSPSSVCLQGENRERRGAWLRKKIKFDWFGHSLLSCGDKHLNQGWLWAGHLHPQREVSDCPHNGLGLIVAAISYRCNVCTCSYQSASTTRKKLPKQSEGPYLIAPHTRDAAYFYLKDTIRQTSFIVDRTYLDLSLFAFCVTVSNFYTLE